MKETSPPLVTRTEPWLKQRECYDFCYHRKASLINMVMGAGKTKVMLDLIGNWRTELTMIVGPKPTFRVWPTLVEKHWDHEHWLPVNLIVNGKTPLIKRITAIESALKVEHANLVLLNYESLTYPVMQDWLRSMNWEVAVLDESHHIKGAGAKTSMFLGRFGPEVPRRLAMTGSAMDHAPIDIYGQFRFLDPTIFKTVAKFREEYCVMGGFEGREILGYRNLKGLGRKFSSMAFVADESDMPELPETADRNVYGQLTGDSARVYKEISKKFVADVNGGVITTNNALTRMLRLQQVTSGFVPDHTDTETVLGHDKRNLFSGLLEDIPKPEPIVVFCQFDREVADVKEAAARSGRKALELSGKQDDYDEWVRNGGVLATQIKSGKEGLDFTNCRYVVYYTLPQSLGDYKQSRKRCHRPGQTRKVIFLHLIMEGTVNEVVQKALSKGADVIREVMGWARAAKEGTR